MAYLTIIHRTSILKGVEDRSADVKRLNGDDPSISDINLVSFWPAATLIVHNYSRRHQSGLFHGHSPEGMDC